MTLRSDAVVARLSAALVLAVLFMGSARGGDAVPACPPAPANNVRVITGAPYSALGTTETVTTLADGNRIVRRNRVRLWRDSDGRTRSEYVLSTITGPTPLELHARVTVIDDPAARERYMLQADGRVAVVPIVPCRPETVSLEPDVTVGPPRPAHLPLRVSRPVSLGERRVRGELAAGSRVEATIPAGAVGNEQPIEMSAEQWYGKDLQVVVEATYRDPRTGETRYRLSDIERAEPDAALFQVPERIRYSPAPVRDRR